MFVINENKKHATPYEQLQNQIERGKLDTLNTYT